MDDSDLILFDGRAACTFSDSPVVVADAILAELEATAHLAPESFEAMAQNIRRFARFCERGLGRASFDEVGPEDAEQFIAALTKAGSRPTVNTRHQRRSAIRLLFSRGRSMSLLTSDPTLDIALPTRSGLKARPLEDDEVAVAREWALDQRFRGHRAPVWALAEAGAHQGEIAEVCIEDLDMAAQAVRFRGGRRAVARTALFTPWGADQIARYLRRMGNPTGGRLLPLTHPEHKGRASSVGMTLRTIFEDAGLTGDDLCGRSIVAWAGLQVFKETARIEQVALRLGMRRLDAAAALIAWQWRGGAS